MAGWVPPLRTACRFVIVASLLATFGCEENVPAPEPVAAPDLSPEGGAYDGALEVTLRTDTEGAGIRYTIDGSTPSAVHGRPYDGFPFTVSSSVTIRAVAWMAGRPDSPVTTVTYTLAGDLHLAQWDGTSWACR